MLYGSHQYLQALTWTGFHFSKFLLFFLFIVKILKLKSLSSLLFLEIQKLLLYWILFIKILLKCMKPKHIFSVFKYQYCRKEICETIACKIASKIFYNKYNLGNLYNKKLRHEEINWKVIRKWKTSNSHQLLGVIVWKRKSYQKQSTYSIQ